MKAILALEDGSVFTGEGFGARASACGEVCFNTSMTGYQEILTDPSYKGQIVTMTYPLIGNYGVNRQDVESWRPHVGGLCDPRALARWSATGGRICPWPSTWSRTASPASRDRHPGADQEAAGARRAQRLYLHRRTSPTRKRVRRAKEWPGLVGVDYVKEVTHKEAFPVGREGSSRAPISTWSHGTDGAKRARSRDPLPPADIPIVAYDYGMKYNILRRLAAARLQGPGACRPPPRPRKR